jgi:putative ABC transport system permease protein
VRTLLQDLRYAVRTLLKSPGFTGVAVLALALGIGANTAIFSVVNGVLLRPLDYEDPGRLVTFRETRLPQFPRFSVSPGNFESWRTGSTAFDGIAAYGNSFLNLTGRGDPEQLRGATATAGLFEMLGAQPALGRVFTAEEDEPGRDTVVVVSHGLWQRRFGGDPTLVGQTLTLNGRVRTVIGIMPSGFEFPQADTALWIPLALTPEQRDQHGSHYLSAAARLRDGVSLEQATAELQTIAERLEQEFPQSNEGWGVVVTPMLDSLVADSRPTLLVLLGAVGLVLLIACANVANMLLARATGRQKEIATRLALGAGRGRVVSQLLTESLVLGLLGGGSGVVLAVWGLSALPALAPELPRIDGVALDARVLGFTALVTLATSVAFGLVPALHASRPDLVGSLKEGGHGASGGRGRRRARSLLVVGETALALVLLIGAGLLIKSFWLLQQVDPGFDAEDVLVVGLSLPDATYPEPADARAFYHQLVDRITTAPGVRAVGVTQSLPFFGDYVLGYRVEGRPEPEPGQMQATNHYVVTPGYFEAMGIALRRGRFFTDLDREDGVPVLLINETLARQEFPDEDPIGQRIHVTHGQETVFREIVGVVADVKQYDLASTARAQTYEAFWQRPFQFTSIVVSTESDPRGLASVVRRDVLSIDGDQPLSRVLTLEEIVGRSIAQERASSRLLTLFGGIALLLAAVGIYGVLAYSVAQRTREFGIRMAVGADGGDVMRLVLGQGLALTATGIAVGLAAAAAVTRVMASQLYEVAPIDPATFLVVPLALFVAAFAACCLPALRATRVDPLVALRSE